MLSGCLEDTEKLTSHLLVNMKNKILQSHESLMCNIKYNSPTFFNLEFFPCIALLHVWNRKLVFSHLYICTTYVKSAPFCTLPSCIHSSKKAKQADVWKSACSAFHLPFLFAILLFLISQIQSKTRKTAGGKKMIWYVQ
jgi:hypothetical protein